MLKLTQKKIQQLKQQARIEQKRGFRYIKDRQFQIDSFTSDTSYVVDLDADTYIDMCSCPSRKKCKHIEYAQQIERYRNEQRGNRTKR